MILLESRPLARPLTVSRLASSRLLRAEVDDRVLTRDPRGADNPSCQPYHARGRAACPHIAPARVGTKKRCPGPENARSRSLPPDRYQSGESEREIREQAQVLER